MFMDLSGLSRLSVFSTNCLNPAFCVFGTRNVDVLVVFLPAFIGRLD